MDDAVMRAYRQEDLKAMVTLDDLCFAEPFRFSKTSMRRFAEAAKARVVVTESAGMLVGFCILHIEGAGMARTGYVVTLDVAPHRRRDGLATRMMETVEQEACEAGCGRMALHVFAGNVAAVAFYERRGFMFSHEAKEFYGKGLDGWVFTKAVVSG